jgi:transposase
MTLGLAERQGRLGNVAVARCEAELPQRSIYRLLHAERDRLFADELFADLYVQHGRRSVPPSILAVVMVLQRLEGCSDREAVDRFAYDLRWRYAAGVDDEVSGFAHTVLVELRARLRHSTDPDRIFRVTTQLARQLGLVGVRRVLDSAPLLDAVATLDTVSLVRGGIRGLLRALPAELAAQVRAGLRRNDDYATAGKPTCAWDDPAAREELVDVLFRDGYRALFALRGAQLDPDAAQAAELLAMVIGQDIQETPDGRFAIAEGVAPDRVISLADPQARHGHKTAAHGFDGYKGHIASDPDGQYAVVTVFMDDLSTLATEPVCYLTTTGRSSGRPHTIEIWFALHGTTVYLLSGGGENPDWVKNLQRDPAVQVRIGTGRFTGRAR